MTPNCSHAAFELKPCGYPLDSGANEVVEWCDIIEHIRYEKRL
jgi:hypothetical protein